MWRICCAKRSMDRYKRAPKWKPVTITTAGYVQCGKCYKWRIVPNKHDYAVIREQLTREQPWVCELAQKWNSGANCDLPSDYQQDSDSQTMVMDKPRIPAPPEGWERIVTLRASGSTKFADIYYKPPEMARGRLRSKMEIMRYIAKHPESVPPGTGMNQFSFAIPYPPSFWIRPKCKPRMSLKKLCMKASKLEGTGKDITSIVKNEGSQLSMTIEELSITIHPSTLSTLHQVPSISQRSPPATNLTCPSPPLLMLEDVKPFSTADANSLPRLSLLANASTSRRSPASPWMDSRLCSAANSPPQGSSWMDAGPGPTAERSMTYRASDYGDPTPLIHMRTKEEIKRSRLALRDGSIAPLTGL